jgi:hypothetical protein
LLLICCGHVGQADWPSAMSRILVSPRLMLPLRAYAIQNNSAKVSAT